MHRFQLVLQKLPIRAITLALSLLLTACGEEPQQQLPAPQKGSTLTVLTAADYPPFALYKTKAKARVMTGFDVELIKRIGQYLSYEIELIDYDFDDIIPALSQHKAHLAIAAISVNPKREKQIAFSNPYYSARNVLLLPTGSPLIQDDDFTGIRLGVRFGSTQEPFAKIWQQKHKDIKLVTFQRDKEVMTATISRKVDAAIVEETPAQAYIQVHEESLTYRLLEDDKAVFAIAFPKDSPLVEEFNKALDHLESIGELDELKQKWFVR